MWHNCMMYMSFYDILFPRENLKKYLSFYGITDYWKFISLTISIQSSLAEELIKDIWIRQ